MRYGNDYVTVETRTFDTISRELSKVVNAIGGRKSMNADEIQALWDTLYAIRNTAYDAASEGAKRDMAQ